MSTKLTSEEIGDLTEFYLIFARDGWECCTAVLNWICGGDERVEEWE